MVCWPGRVPKYRNRKVEVEPGRIADSLKEANRWWALRQREAAGEISDLTWHPSWPLVVNGVRISRFTADSSYRQGDAVVVEDVKSEPTRRTRDYLMRKKLMLALYGIEIREYL